MIDYAKKYKHGKQVIVNRVRNDGAWMTKAPYTKDDGFMRLGFLDGDVYPGIEGVIEYGWRMKPTPADVEYPVIRHNESDTTLYIYGSDPMKPFDVNGVVELYLEGEKHIIDHSCMVYIPKGFAYGPIIFKQVDRPIFVGFSMPDANKYEAEIVDAHPVLKDMAEADKQYGKYIVHNTKRTDPDPEWFKTEAFKKDGFQKICILNGEVLPGAPMSDSDWKTTSTPEGGGHPFHYHPNASEVLAFCGSDPLHAPESLNCRITWYIEGEPVEIEEACFIYMPRNVEHGPLVYKDVVHEKAPFGFQAMLGGAPAREYVSFPQT